MKENDNKKRKRGLFDNFIFRVGKDQKSKFKKACEKEGVKASEDLRNYMNKKIEQHENAA